MDGEVSVNFNLIDFLASLSMPFFGIGGGYQEEPGIVEETSDSDEDSSGAEVGSLAEVGVDANGNVFTNAGAGVAMQEDDSGEGFSLFSFTSTVIHANGDDVSVDTLAGSQVIEEDGDEAHSFSNASLDMNGNGIAMSSNTNSGAVDT